MHRRATPSAAQSPVIEATLTRRKRGWDAALEAKEDKDTDAAQPGAIRLFALPCLASRDGNGAPVVMSDGGYNVQRGARTPFAGKCSGAVRLKEEIRCAPCTPNPCRVVDISSLAEKFDFAQLSASWVQITLLLLPVLKRLQNVVVALDANICAIAVEVLQLDLTRGKRYGC